MYYYFIAVNYNGSKFTKEYIESINNLIYDQSKIRIIIVDNASNSIDKEKLSSYISEYANIEILFSDNNLGYFGGLNLALDSIKYNSKSFVIIGNNDLVFENDFLEKLEKVDFTEEVLVISPKVTTKAGVQQNPLVVDKVSFIERVKAEIYYSNYYIGQIFRFLNKILKNTISFRKSNSFDYPQMKIKRGIGACYILTKNYFNHFGKLDDRIFLWGEEVLLSHQVESVDGCILYVPTLKIEHHESASVVYIQDRKRYDMIKKSYQIYKKYL